MSRWRLGLAIAFVCALVVGCGGGDTPVTLTPEQVPPATVGQPFDVQVLGRFTSGGTVPLNVSVLKGSLPPGIGTYQMPGNGTGASGLRGTPTTAGT